MQAARALIVGVSVLVLAVSFLRSLGRDGAAGVGVASGAERAGLDVASSQTDGLGGRDDSDSQGADQSSGPEVPVRTMIAANDPVSAPSSSPQDTGQRKPRIRCRGGVFPPAHLLLRDREFNVKAVALSDDEEQALQSVIDYENQFIEPIAAQVKVASDQYLEGALKAPSSRVTPGAAVHARGAGNGGHSRTRYATGADGKTEIRRAVVRTGDSPDVDALSESYAIAWKIGADEIIDMYLGLAKKH